MLPFEEWHGRQREMMPAHSIGLLNDARPGGVLHYPGTLRASMDEVRDAFTKLGRAVAVEAAPAAAKLSQAMAKHKRYRRGGYVLTARAGIPEGPVAPAELDAQGRYVPDATGGPVPEAQVPDIVHIDLPWPLS